MNITEDAEVAYNGYRDHTGGISLASGGPIPEWKDLRPDIQAAWKASAAALRKIMLCEPHWNLDQSDSLEPFDNCVACIRVERNELRTRFANTKRITEGIAAMLKEPK